MTLPSRIRRFLDKTSPHRSYDSKEKDEHAAKVTLTRAGKSETLNLAEFQYTAFEDAARQIRLLKYPDHQNDFEIIQVDLTIAPPFRALSYTWDREACQAYELAVDGKGLKVGKNLFEFLQVWFSQWKKPAIGEYLWIDQICINQQALGEKNSQVQMMDQIYKQADEVLIWLGAGNCTEDMEKDTKQLRLWRSEWPKNWSDHPKYDEDTVRHMTSGNDDTLFLEFCDAHDDLYSWGGYAVGANVSGVPAVVHYSRTRDGFLTPYEHNILMDNRCADLRDKYYGLQGLFAPIHRIKVDYERPLYEVFLDAAVMVLKAIDYQKAVESPQYKHSGLFGMISPVISIASFFQCLKEKWWKRHRSKIEAVMGAATERYLMRCYTDDTAGVLTEQSKLTNDSFKHEKALGYLREDIDQVFRGPMKFSSLRK